MKGLRVASVQLVAVIGLLSLIVIVSPAIAEPGTILNTSPDGGTTLAVSYCPDEGEFWVECVSHDLSCKDGEFKFYVAGDDSSGTRLVEIVRHVLKEGYGTAKLPFRLDKHETSIDLTVAGLELSGNDMNGTFDLSLSLGGPSKLLDAITQSTKSLVAVVGDESLEFAPRPEDAAKLLQFKQACLANRG